jgi:uncharacterized protein YdbL (DUF1318 family)
MKKHALIAAMVAALFAMPAAALDLHSARATGLVAETAEGYIKAVKPSAEVNALVAEVNAKRRAEYARISAENGQPIDVVGKLAAPQIAKSIAAGN